MYPRRRERSNRSLSGVWQRRNFTFSPYQHRHVLPVTPVTATDSPFVENTTCKGTLIQKQLAYPLSISAIGWR